MKPPRCASASRATAKVKSLEALSTPFCFSMTSGPKPEARCAVLSETPQTPVVSNTFCEGLGTVMSANSSAR